MSKTSIQAPTRILAKSARDKQDLESGETLRHHTEQVMIAVSTLCDEVGEQALESMGLRDHITLDELRVLMLSCALIHDLGKLNHQFQRMLRADDRVNQALRHEWISAWLLVKFPELQDWIFARFEKVEGERLLHLCLCTVLFHHLKTRENKDLHEPRPGSGDDTLWLWLSHEDVAETLALGQHYLGLDRPPALTDVALPLLERPVLPGLAEDWLGLELLVWFERLASDADKRLMALMKCLLMSADVAGSAVSSEGVDTEGWVRQALSRVCERGELAQVAKQRLRGHSARPFQEAVAASDSSVTFVSAGCGSGKTVAAYLWAERHAVGRQLFFCYPTTGTASEGYRDYAMASELSADSSLLHGRRDVDLQALQDNGLDAIFEPAEVKTKEANSPELDRFLLERAKVSALEAWHAPLVVCTTDQVLGLVQCQRRPLYASPAIFRGAFVFDEIHLYDDHLFDALVHFLRTFSGAPVLLMTASLQSERRERLEDLLASRGESLSMVEGPSDLEELPRYRIEPSCTSLPWDRIVAALQTGEKVLLVVNQVKRCIAAFDEAKERLTALSLGQLPVCIYHSRFRYEDRVDRHNELIEAFQGGGPVLAITTQVCEVSLDLSADLLITDVAPVPSLIQRMGRLNRHISDRECCIPKPMISVEVVSEMPYTPEQLEVTKTWLERLSANEAVSQLDLNIAFKAVEVEPEPIDARNSAWLEQHALVTPAPLRKAGYTISVIRAEELESCLNERKQPDPVAIVAATIPMIFGPVTRESPGWDRLRGVLVAPHGRIDYDKERGAVWQSV